MKYGFLLACVLMVGSFGSVMAEDWSQWRGPNFNGSSNETNLPSKWSKTENIAWSTELPSAAAATPIIAAGRVFISGADAAKNTLQASCYDRTNGKLLWSHDIKGATRRDERSTYAAPSPVCDGKNVTFFYGSGQLICYDLDGKLKWERNLWEDEGAFAFLWTYASSPLLFDGKLFVQVLQRDVPVDGRGLVGQKNESYILAMEPSTGKTIYKHIRPSRAQAESLESFTTPIPFEQDGEKQLLVIGGDALSGHDPASGKELWRWGTWNPQRIGHWRLVPSPVYGGGVILACGPKREPIFAIKTGGSGKLGDDAIAWLSDENRDVTSDVPTPAFYDDDFFVLSDLRRTLARVEPATGKVKWMIETPGRSKYEASPLAADGKIYIVNFDGDVSVVNATDGKVLETISMDEPQYGEKVRASVVASDGQLFIRTTRNLYCVGK